ncbi:MAG: hypothetical protein ABIZ56_03675 [Chthoniobacteraceae bacterium]
MHDVFEVLARARAVILAVLAKHVPELPAVAVAHADCGALTMLILCKASQLLLSIRLTALNASLWMFPAEFSMSFVSHFSDATASPTRLSAASIC